jgi:CheY-like chemotaxis protein
VLHYGSLPERADVVDGEVMTNVPVLVVDDDPSILRVVAEILDMEGYAVETAPNGAEALKMIERRRPSVVLLDMRMPVMDGWGFARALKEKDLCVPIVVMTAARNAREWAEEIGAKRYVAKPFEVDELIGAIEQVRETGS